MKILFITYENIDYACPRYRVYWPAKGMELAGHCTRVSFLKNCSKKDIDWADVVIFERIVESMAYEPKHYKRMVLARKIISLWNYAILRKITGYDLDDYIFFDDDEFGFYNICTWIQKALLRHSSFVSTTSKFLSRKISSYNKNVVQLHNCIDAMSFLSQSGTNKESNQVTLGWMCGQTHYRDEPIMLDIIRPLVEKYGHAIRFLFVGKISSKMLYLIDPYSSYIQIKNYCDWRILPSLQKETDINLVPLVDCPLNQGKSAINYLESGMLKIPSVCSNMGEFMYSIKDGHNGFLASNTQEWLEKLEMLIEDASLRREIGERAYQDVINNNTIKTQGKMYSAFLEGIPIHSLGVRLGKSISGSVYFMSRWLKVSFAYLMSILKERFVLVQSSIFRNMKKQIKRAAIYFATREKFCFVPESYQRNWHVKGMEEHIFQKLDTINKNCGESDNARRVIFRERELCGHCCS
jgi:glycosyltransferase involved in cell wall biosynthesis